MPGLSCFGTVTRLLLSLDVVVVSHVPSLESNPDSPLPVANIVGRSRTIDKVCIRRLVTGTRQSSRQTLVFQVLKSLILQLQMLQLILSPRTALQGSAVSTDDHDDILLRPKKKKKVCFRFQANKN